ncbi:MAG: sugar phosphate isomerase/epimerase [Planctomycetes bacterium]|nr:sugar phosphate isomerase/epimerase [Planctomycetota bacterium]
MPAAQQTGASAVELEAAGELLPQNLTQTGRREITHLLRSHDLSISAIVCPLRRGVDVAENLEPRLAQIRATMEMAFDLGPRLVIIPFGTLPEKDDDPAAAVTKEALVDLGRHGDRTGVTIALDGVDAPDRLVNYLERFDVGSLGVNFNPANLVIAGHNPHDAVKALNKRMIHAHAQDARRVSPSRMGAVPLGHGDIDWLALLANFEEIEYRGPLTVLGDGRAEIAAGVAFLRRFVA